MTQPPLTAQTLYDLALAIGNSTDLSAMAAGCVPQFVTSLAGVAGGLYHWSEESQLWRAVFTSPATFETHQATAVHHSGHQLPLPPVVKDSQPQHYQTDSGAHLHWLPLPAFGWLLLIRESSPLEPASISQLSPLLTKLAQASRVCQQHQTRQVAYQQIAQAHHQLQQMKTKVQQLANRKQAILNTLPDLLFYLDHEGNILDSKIPRDDDLPANLSVRQLHGRNLGDMLPAELVDLTHHYITQALTTGQLQRFEYQLEVATGLQYFEARLVISGPNELLAIIRNITDRIQAEMALQQANVELEQRVATRTAELQATNDRLQQEIADRHQAQARLQQTEQRYRELFDMAPVMYVITRQQAGEPIISDCNQLFLTTLNYQRAEVLEQPLHRFYSPDSQEALVTGGYQRALEGDFIEEERILLTRQGRPVMTLLRAQPEFDETGQIIGTRAMYVDMTTAKQTQQALHRSEQTLRQLHKITTAYQQSFGDRVMALLELGCQQFNLSLGILARIEGEQYEIRAVTAPPTVLLRSGQILPTKQTYCGQLLASDTTDWPVAIDQISASPLKESSAYQATGLERYLAMPVMVEGERYGTLNFSNPHPQMPPFTQTDKELVKLMAQWIGTELERQQAEKMEHRLRAILEATPDFVGIADVHGQVLYVNRAGKLMVGRQDEDIRQTQISDYLAPEMIEHFMTDVMPLAAQQGVWIGETLFQTRQGKKFPTLQVLLAHKSPAGEVEYYSTITRDISQRKETEAALQRAYVEMEQRVQDRTTALVETNAMLMQEIADRKRVEANLHHLIEFDTLIATLSTNFINLAPNDIDQEINNALAEIGLFAHVDRSYIFLFAEDQILMDNTHEWCAPGIEPQIDNLKDLPRAIFPWFMERLDRYEVIHIPYVDRLPPEAVAEREILEAQEIQSLVAVPLVYGKTTIGFLGFDAVRSQKTWPESNISLLRIVGEILVSALQRKRTEAILSAVVNTVREGILTIDAKGIIITSNQMVKHIWGYQQKELVGQPLSLLLHEKSQPLYQENLAAAFRPASGAIALLDRRVELEGVRKDGRSFPLELHLTETQIGNRLLFTIAVRDITERRELDRLRDEFIATVSHELRTPLAAIMGYTETLLGERPGPLTPIQHRFLDYSYKSSQRLLKLVEELLTVSRIQRGKLELERQPFVPSQAVQDVLDMMNSLAQQKAVTLTVQDEWPADLQIVGDQNRLEQVLTNLLGNAIKFTPEAGQVTLRSQRTDQAWQIEVTDTGIGIPAAEIPKLFHRFQRASNATAEQIQGTGLGLYVCKAIVEAHSGQIELQSEVGQGATFTVTIPLR